MLTRTDTIVAVATAPGRGAVAVVRLSGVDAAAIARRITTPFPAHARTATLATLHAVDDRDAILDHALVTWFAAPASYTGEDVVEFAVHGGTLVSALVMEASIRAGARPALAGEFTERAVINGKMDLVQAEAVADLIDARSRAAHRAAVRQLDGALSQRLGALRESLLHVDALLAYDIDFPDEDEAPPSRARAVAACDDALRQLERLLATLPAAALGRDGALVVLAGPPNAGKSALLNALVGEARVIVSEIPGTTRDAVEVLVDDTPYPLRLVDTAGLRASGDTLELLGIEVSERYLAQAHVVLACAEHDDEIAANREAIARRTQGVVIAVRTKVDLSKAASIRLSEPGAPVRVSTVTGEGLDQLRAAIRNAVAARAATPDADTPVITRARHEAALLLAADEVRAFRTAWAAGSLPAPVAATHLRAAVSALESLIGAVDVEDILDRVFRTFCIGK
jgi:tRNA modification GTPase